MRYGADKPSMTRQAGLKARGGACEKCGVSNWSIYSMDTQHRAE